MIENQQLIAINKENLMIKIDMHAHSKYSEHPSDWFLQRLGAKESYTEPEYLYRTAKERGMDYVTITDHNRIDGAMLLKQKYPQEVIVGLEATTYFPENGCKIHVLLYDINQEQYEIIQQKRKNIYELRDYIKENDLAYSVAHATFSVNNKLTVDLLEKLILLFDVFEGINGGRSYLFNTKWMELMKRLTPAHIDKLYEKHHIEPISDDPWLKSFTGGSDDHAGLFIGQTYTETDADNPGEVIENLKNKKTYANGRHNNYKFLAFTIYKVAFEFARSKNVKSSNSLLFQLTEKIFESDSLKVREKFKIQRFRASNRKNDDQIGKLLVSLIHDTKDFRLSQIDKRLELVFQRVCDIADEFLKKVLTSMEQDISKGNLVGLIMNISSSIPGLFLALPFLSTLKVMYRNRQVLDEITQNLNIELPESEKRILWFTDTINDLNGVSETLKELGWIAYRKNKNIRIVTSVLKKERDKTLPPNIINLPNFFTMKLPYYEKYVLKFPSILKSIETIYTEEPDEIFISTPGPIGLLGLLIARLLNVKCHGVYHTDFTMEIDKIAEDNALTELVEGYTRWFYQQMDTIKVSSHEYAHLLEERGFDSSKIRFLSKAIDTELFSYKESAKEKLLRQLNMQDGVNLLYAGRVSKDKHMDLLVDIYQHLSKKRQDVNLIIVGDGPYFEALKDRMKDFERIFFTGKIPRKELPEIYSSSDVFVFPSTTDTFGMVVMEAQSCGLPSVVSSVGGPKEILIDGKTGYIVQNGNVNEWVEKIEALIDLKENQPLQFSEIKKHARLNVLDKYNWDRCLESIVDSRN
ncbi:glycosyltransferase [candidate division KSB1 bacterium]|nr:glycosyltransferase [candidate division KSB1 bacterium]